MNDTQRVYAKCNQAQLDGDVIDHGTARTIASWFQQSDGITDVFVSTGAIDVVRRLWVALMDDGGFDLYRGCDFATRFAIMNLAHYILTSGTRGPVPGWSDMWVS
jgi:hypothetical protein